MEFIIFLLKFDIPSINTNDLNRLFENNKFNEKAKKIAHSMTYQSGGRIVSNIGDILVCQIPIDSSEKILEIKKE